MEIVKDLGVRINKHNIKTRYGIFLCSFCKCHIEKRWHDGIHALFCSRKCTGEAHRGSKRGSIHEDGKVVIGKYIYLYMPDHPSASGSRKNYIAEHRYVMEQHIGRLLKRKEQVHHINEDTKDNRIENLELLSAHEHMKQHAEIWRKEKRGFFSPANRRKTGYTKEK